MNKDTIYRQDATNALKEVIKNVSNNYTELNPMVMAGCGFIEDCIYELESLPSARSEALTDNEQRIFLAAMSREENVCKQVDDEFRGCREPYEDSLVRICREIIRKVKATLWTT